MAKEGDSILDIFAGTGSVGFYLHDKYNIISNDIQTYSSIICDALMGPSVHEQFFDIESSLRLLKKHFNKNKESIEAMFPKTLKASEAFLSIVKKGWGEGQRKEYIEFIEAFPSPLNQFKGKSGEQKILFKEFEKRRGQASIWPYLQTTFLWAETYFSFQQCMDIDSLKFAIDQTFDDERGHSIGMAALIYAHSYCSSGTGHFAQFRDLKDLKSVNDVFLYRERNVWDYFDKKFREILKLHTNSLERRHRSTCLDYRDLLKDRNIMKEVDIIYADPPYSFVHYSRFYHATESLVKYDYMAPEFKGRYRTDRHQSPFCQKKNVEKAFKILFESVASHGKKLLLSYANTCLISLDEIIKIMKSSGMSYTIREVDYNHSTMGREGHKSNQIKEYLVSAHSIKFQ